MLWLKLVNTHTLLLKTPVTAKGSSSTRFALCYIDTCKLTYTLTLLCQLLSILFVFIGLAEDLNYMLIIKYE
jgi:hypothetical protein